MSREPENPTASIGSDPTLVVTPITVEAIDGPGKGPRATLKSGSLTVGSDKACELRIEDDTVSRRHALLELLPGEVMVRDLESRNGTRYLGAKISTAHVPIGGTIKVGKTTLQFRPEKGGVPASTSDELQGLIGRSLSMKRIFAQLERIGPMDSTVLLLGETGAGKGATAKALHALSPRAARPFVVFDCAAAHPNLLESALFGHVRGAFTGADQDRPGAVAAANGGTLFLDEVGELPASAQPRLLRLLEAREFLPVGGTHVQRAQVRVIAATHRVLKDEVVKGRFRQDLYYRLAVAELTLPPLRDRLEDIPLLAQRFAREIAGVEVALSPPTIAAFQSAGWPGNVRELRNAVERTVTLGDPGLDGPALDESFIGARDSALERFEKDYLVSLLARHDGNASAAARTAKLARSHFYRLLTKHGLVQKSD